MKLILLMALTADGKIARSSVDFPDWTGREDKIMFKTTTLRAGVLIMGSKTYDTIGRPLPGRKNVVITRDKRRMSDRDDLVFTDKAPRALLQELEDQGYTEAVLAGGSHINYLFAREGVIDEIHITYAPVVFGEGLPLFAGPVSMDLELKDLTRLGADRILAIYRVVR
jgi:dihydrofolate reductase